MLATEAATPNEGCGFRMLDLGKGRTRAPGIVAHTKFPLAVVGILRATADSPA